MDTMLAILLGLNLLNIIYLIVTDTKLKQIVRGIKQVLKGFRDKENS